MVFQRSGTAALNCLFFFKLKGCRTVQCDSLILKSGSFNIYLFTATFLPAFFFVGFYSHTEFFFISYTIRLLSAQAAPYISGYFYSY
jgi:hypothetical protein